MSFDVNEEELFEGVPPEYTVKMYILGDTDFISEAIDHNGNLVKRSHGYGPKESADNLIKQFQEKPQSPATVDGDEK